MCLFRSGIPFLQATNVCQKLGKRDLEISSAHQHTWNMSSAMRKSFSQTVYLTFGPVRDIFKLPHRSRMTKIIIKNSPFHLVVVWYSVVHVGTNLRERNALLWSFRHCFQFYEIAFQMDLMYRSTSEICLRRLLRSVKLNGEPRKTHLREEQKRPRFAHMRNAASLQSLLNQLCID